jgi:hypothetical protein
LFPSSSIIPHKGNVLAHEQPKNSMKRKRKVKSLSEEVEILDELGKG